MHYSQYLRKMYCAVIYHDISIMIKISPNISHQINPAIHPSLQSIVFWFTVFPLSHVRSSQSSLSACLLTVCDRFSHQFYCDIQRSFCLQPRHVQAFLFFLSFFSFHYCKFASTVNPWQYKLYKDKWPVLQIPCISHSLLSLTSPCSNSNLTESK